MSPEFCAGGNGWLAARALKHNNSTSLHPGRVESIFSLMLSSASQCSGYVAKPTKPPDWLLPCLTHPSHSAAVRFVAHCFQAIMPATSVKSNRRRQDRTRAVLPVRVRGKDVFGVSFDELAHTLDLAPSGVRLGSIRRELKALDTLVVLYRQRRVEFKVVWTKLLDGNHEYQVGLQSFTQEREPWGINFFNSSAVAGAA